MISLGVDTCCDKMVDEIAWGDDLSIDLVAEISEGDGGDGCLGSFLAEINTVDEFRFSLSIALYVCWQLLLEGTGRSDI